jgi:hypothetical protein
MALINDGVEQIPSTWKDITSKVIDSKQIFEVALTHSGLGLFQNMNEVDGVTFDAAISRYTKSYWPIIRTLGVKYSKQSRQKDLYGFVKSMAPMLAEAAAATMNLLVCNVLNGGFSGGSITSPDGQPLFSAAHPLLNGSTYSNLGTSALGGLALEDAIQNVNGVLGDRGIPKYFRGGFNLVVGPFNEGIAHRSVKSEGLQGTFDNDTNSWIGGSIKKIVVDPMIGFGQTSMQHSWFLLPAEQDKNPIFWMQVQGLQVDNDKDIRYGEIMFVADFEGLADCMGWRGTYGISM